MQIDNESFKLFFLLIQNGNVDISIERLDDFYELSKRFEILKLIESNIRINNLDYAIPKLGRLNSNENEDDCNLKIKIETILSERKNDCIKNPNFGKLHPSIIHNILTRDNNVKIDDNLLLDFIFESVDTRYIFFPLVEKYKLKEEKLERLIEFLKEKSEQQQKMYLNWIPFDLLLHIQMKNKIDQLKRDLKKANDEINKLKKDLDRCPLNIFFGGYDGCTHFGQKLTTIKDGEPIYHPLNSLINHHILSFSIFNNHSVIVTSDGLLFGIGNNKDGRICGLLKKECISEFTEFSIPEIDNKQTPISAVCTTFGTLYLYSNDTNDEKQLVYCDSEINEPVFLNICNQKPIALFGGHYHTAAITDKGEIIFINRFAVKNSSNSPIKAVSLPNGEKASSIACGNELIVVLSVNGLVFSSSFQQKSNLLNFEVVKELEDEEIVSISGSFEHFFAVNKDGHVFGRGRNCCGELGLGKIDYNKNEHFIEIPTLKEQKISDAYAGTCFSLFQTKEGKILSCGCDNHGQLLKNYKKEETDKLPTETLVKSGAKFCIAANVLCIAFIERPPPPNTPNMRIIL